VLLSGTGTTFQSLAERARKGDLDAELAAVVASRAEAPGLERARRLGIPAHAVDRRTIGDERAFQDALHAVLDRYAPDLLLLAGFLSRIELRGRWVGRAMNSHPALIPAFSGKGFYGDRVHRAVLDSGVKVSGATVHFVDEEYDTGPIILQQAVPVEDDDSVETLRERVQAVERDLYARAVQLFAEDRLRIEGRRVRILGAPAS
jgi:formyltetrahydrofolate-dependent phosphoribosylglycinamide formyltransferase